MAIFYVYIYFDPRTNTPFYIGKGKGPRAWAKHSGNKSFCGRIRKLKKLGLEYYVRGMTGLSEAKALMIEELLIAVFGRRDLERGPLLNLTDGGDGGCPGYRHTASNKAKISAAKKGKPYSAEQRIQMSLDQKGKRHSRDTKLKISATMLGQAKPNETKANMRTAFARWRKSCPHCGEVCNWGTKRLHFNVCTKNPGREHLGPGGTGES